MQVPKRKEILKKQFLKENGGPHGKKVESEGIEQKMIVKMSFLSSLEIIEFACIMPLSLANVWIIVITTASNTNDLCVVCPGL